MKLNLKNMSIKTKITTFVIAINVVFIAYMLVMVVPEIESEIMKDKQTSLVSQIDLAHGIMKEMYSRVASRKMTEDSAKKVALERIGELRYDGNNYFWINDFEKMVQNPVKKENNGKELSGIKDPNGKQYMIELVNKCKAGGQGFIEYVWKKEGDPKNYSKMSLGRLFEPWGWIVGTGMNTDDISDRLDTIRVTILIWTLILSALVIVVGQLVSNAIAKPIRKCVAIMDGLAQGKLDL